MSAQVSGTGPGVRRSLEYWCLSFDKPVHCPGRRGCLGRFIGRLLGEKVNVGGLDTLRRIDHQSLQERERFAQAAFRSLAFGESNLEFKEVSQPFHSIQMDARPAHQIQRPVLAYTANLTIGEAKRFPQHVRRGRRGAEVEGVLWARLIGSAV